MPLKRSTFIRNHPLRKVENVLDTSKLGQEAELIDFFPTSLCFSVNNMDVENKKWHTDFKNHLVSLYESNPNDTVGAWKTSDLMKVEGVPGIDGFKDYLKRKFQEYLKEFCNDKSVVSTNWQWNAWPNVKSNNSWHLPHFHERAEVSFIYYLSVVECTGPEDLKKTSGGESYGGLLSFLDPRGAAPYMSTKFLMNSRNDSKLHIVPREGLLILFPSYLVHTVAPVNSDGIRASVAGNFWA